MTNYHSIGSNPILFKCAKGYYKVTYLNLFFQQLVSDTILTSKTNILRQVIKANIIRDTCTKIADKVTITTLSNLRSKENERAAVSSNKLTNNFGSLHTRGSLFGPRRLTMFMF
jgi:hypothetical protein